MITLIIVDCQNDFLTGTLSVKGARRILEPIKEFIKKHSQEIAKIIFTVDWHPITHCSFVKQGGIWPQHCVQYTPGACIESKLLKFVHNQEIPYSVFPKGTYEDTEEYGAFSDPEFDIDQFGHRIYFDAQNQADATTDFVVCGIAGDYCVKETIQNLLNLELNVMVFTKGIASIDDGSTLARFIRDNNLKKIN